MTKLITVGYDGSPSSIEAVHWAAAEATLRCAALRMVTCYDLPVTGPGLIGFGYPEALAAVHDDAENRVEEMAAAVRASHPSIDVTTLVESGPPSATLVDDLDADDLVVVGASAHEGAAAFWLGSTPRSVVHHSHCPVAVIRGGATIGRAARIVVGIDGSDASNDALLWASDEADRHRAELIVVHGWSYPYIAVDVSSAQARDLTQIDAACTLDAAVELVTARCAAPVTGHLVEATAANALLQTVQDGDLLVVGSRGRGGVVNAIFGSTANLVLDHCAVPMIVVHPTERA
ncbi:MAG: hypothetical protein JWM34_1964 [Ilumatobacteraceae bacterium]|nr:hypothetical protein [Ilumatobacteraceae bacterium]